MAVRGVSREVAIADYGVVLTREPDEDLVSYDGGPMAWQGTKGPGAAQSLAGDSTRSTPPTNRYPPTPEGRVADSTSR